MALNQSFVQDTFGDIGIAAQVTTSAPTYTTGTLSPLSLGLSGLLRVDGSNVTQPISASTLPLPTGASTSALQSTGNATLLTISGQLPPALGPQASAASLSVVQATGTVFAISATALPLPAGAATSALQITGNTSLATIAAELPAALGPQATSASLSIVPATGAVFNVTANVSTTGTITSVPLAIASTTALAANSARKGFIIYNDSLAMVFLAFAATASTTAFSTKIQAGAEYEPGEDYTGIITFVASAAVGNLRVTEFT